MSFGGVTALSNHTIWERPWWTQVLWGLKLKWPAISKKIQNEDSEFRSRGLGDLGLLGDEESFWKKCCLS
jgi:hypothetical protein